MTIEYPTIAECIGNTPMVRLQRLPGTTSNTILVKLEGNNPAGSVKDRPALSMIEHAERRGAITPGDTLIEATSGNTGIALAMVAAMKGYRMVLIMPNNMSAERKSAMTAYGAQLIEVTQSQGMEGARDMALRMQAEGRGKVLDQFGNQDNPEAHYHGTGQKYGATRAAALPTLSALWARRGPLWEPRAISRSRTRPSRLWVCSRLRALLFRAFGAGQKSTCQRFLMRRASTG